MRLRRTSLALAGALATVLALPASGMAVTGTVTEFPVNTAASGPFGITGGPDGNVWFTEKNAVKLGRLNPNLPASVTNPVDFATGGAAPYDIISGGTDTLWMTDQGNGKLYKVTNLAANPPTITAQAVVLAAPTGLALGPDNDIWVNQMAGSVQRVKPDGTADGAAIVTGGTNLNSIAKNADGSLMFVTDLNDGPAGNNGLIKITTGATKTATAITIGANKGPRGVVNGSDNKMYFAESGTAGEKIGRVNADGTGFAETSALTGGVTDPEGLSLGQDGNVYVAAFNGAQIGQVTPALGAITQFKTGITGPTGPREIAMGADKNEWFTNETNNKVDRLTVDAPPPPPTPGGGGSSSSTGAASGTSATTTPPAPVDNSGTPQVSNVALSPARFRVGAQATAVSAAAKGSVKTGTTITYLLTKDATATLQFEHALPGRKRGSGCVRPNRRNRTGKKCTRFAVKGSITRAGTQGQNAVPFSGRIGSRALAPGRYRVGIAATDAQGRAGLLQYATFVILPQQKAKARKH
jgi:virginiamycin B lyase